MEALIGLVYFQRASMQGGKIFFIVGILGLIAGVATLVVGIVLIVKSRDADDEVITPVFHE